MSKEGIASGGAASKAASQMFTVEQANRTLPLVRRIVRDVIARYEELEALRKERRALLAKGRRAAADDVRMRGEPVVDALNTLVDELADIGCQLKDAKIGLLDFPGRRRNKPVLLCWHYGEDAITHWHEMHAGFPGRRPIDEACD